MNLATIDHLLTTTRSVRKRLDLSRPVAPSVIQECLEIAIQAPSGSNRQGWRFLVVTDVAKRAAIAKYYADSFSAYMRRPAETGDVPEKRKQRMGRVADSAMYLARHMHEVPVLVITCIEGRPDSPLPLAQASLYGSILPAAWSFMLALRSRGLGSAWTTLHLAYEAQVAELLGIPPTFSQAALLPVAYYKGDDFRPAVRVPAKEVTFWESWGDTL